MRARKAGVAFESKAECLQDDIADDAIPEGALNYELSCISMQRPSSRTLKAKTPS